MNPKPLYTCETFLLFGARMTRVIRVGERRGVWGSYAPPAPHGGKIGVMGYSGHMVELPNVDPVPPRSDLSRTDLVAVLKGLAPGWYMSGPLLPRVNLWLKSQGRDPVSAKTLGESLVRRLGVERRNGPGHARQFLITPAAVAGRDWFTDTSAGTDPATEKEQP